ncbi:hypothetical protein LB465_10765 [Salegentibacter sp. LM13S]|uniref:hypothetical protein n=1 Tax=Salegentibacter lacus TaxID=2873599 RepID=UPI001CCBA553|nr:hypothetical protein [Salegentibacter lacus]MBZ9631260.1 hypothetical protein [Salegentibacter lacus]
MKSKSDVYHDGLGISSVEVRSMSSLPQLLTYQERVYSDVMDMNLKEEEVRFKIKNESHEVPELKESLGKLVYKKKLYNILYEQINRRVEIVKVSNYIDECQVFKEITKDYFSLSFFNKLDEEAKKKFQDQLISN